MRFFQVYIVMGLENAPSVSRTYKSYLTMWKTSIFPILPHALCVGKYFLQLTKWGIIEAQVIDKGVTILRIDLNISLFVCFSLTGNKSFIESVFCPRNSRHVPAPNSRRRGVSSLLQEHCHKSQETHGGHSLPWRVSLSTLWKDIF